MLTLKYKDLCTLKSALRSTAEHYKALAEACPIAAEYCHGEEEHARRLASQFDDLANQVLDMDLGASKLVKVCFH